MKLSYSFIVTIEVEDHAEMSAQLVRNYVRHAVNEMRGCYLPEHPIHNIKRIGVRHAPHKLWRKT